MSKFSTPFMAKSPLRQNGEIRPASEVLEGQAGYNKNTNTVMQAGTVSASPGGLGSGQSLSLLSKIGAGLAAGATAVAGYFMDKGATEGYKESQEKYKKNVAEIKARNSKIPQV
jgi:hypothetical protein